MTVGAMVTRGKERAKEQRERGHLSKDGLTYDDGQVRRVYELVEDAGDVERLRVVEEVFR